MSKREDYEHLELDNDGCYYWFTNNDVNEAPKPKEIAELRDWFCEEENKYKDRSLYYKGTRLYFTYQNKKFYFRWVFYGEKLISDAVKRLKDVGAVNIQINYGELD